jgi:hypothetical protein
MPLLKYGGMVGQGDGAVALSIFVKDMNAV